MPRSIPSSSPRQRTTNKSRRVVSFSENYTRVPDTDPAKSPLRRVSNQSYQSSPFSQSPLIRALPDEFDPENYVEPKIREETTKDYWKKQWLKTKGYKAPGTISVGFAVGSGITSVFFPPLAIPFGIIAGSAFLATLVRLGYEKKSTAELDDIIKRYKRIAATLATSSVGLAVGAGFTGGYLGIPAIVAGVLTGLSASVMNRAVERKNALFRESTVSSYLQADSLEHRTQLQSIESEQSQSNNKSQGQSRDLSKSSKKSNNLKYKKNYLKGWFKSSAGTSDNLATYVAPTTSSSASKVLGSGLGAITQIAEPILSVAAFGFALAYERQMTKSGKFNMKNAEEKLKEEYKKYDSRRYGLVQRIVGAAFNQMNREYEVDQWINFYLIRAVFESGLTNDELDDDGSSSMPIASVKQTVSRLEGFSYGQQYTAFKDHKEALEQIDDWQENYFQSDNKDDPGIKGKYTTRSKLAVLDALPILKMMVTDDLVKEVRDRKYPGYTREIDEIMDILGHGGREWTDWNVDFKIDIESTDNKKAFGFYIRQAVAACYEANLIFGKAEAKATTIKMVGRHIQEYLGQPKTRKPPVIKKGYVIATEVKEAIPNKIALIELANRNLQGLSDDNKHRLGKVSVYNDFHLEQISAEIATKSHADFEGMVELCVYHRVQKYKKDKKEDVPSYFNQYKYILGSKKHIVGDAVEKSLAAQEEKLIPDSPYKGLGVKLRAIKQGEDFVLRISGIFAPEIKRFKLVGGGDEFVDNKILHEKSITHLIVNGKIKSINEFAQDEQTVDLAEIKKCFSGENGIGFICDGKQYVFESDRKQIYVTRNCEGLKKDLGENYGEVYNPIKHGVRVFRDLRDNIIEASKKYDLTKDGPKLHGKMEPLKIPPSVTNELPPQPSTIQQDGSNNFATKVGRSRVGRGERK